MFIEVNDNNGTKYLRLVESKRAFTKSGKPTCKKNIIFTSHINDFIYGNIYV